MAVTSKLNTIGKPRCEVVDECHGIFAVAPAHKPRWDQLGIGVDRGPRPYIAIGEVPLGGRNVLLLAVNECPDFIDLNALAGEVAEHAILIPKSGPSGIDQQPA